MLCSLLFIAFYQYRYFSDAQNTLQGHNDSGILTNKVKDNPQAIVLLDKVENAHLDILTVFLQLFDDGE